MGEHPIENLMLTAMNSIQNMVDVNTIVGEPIQAMNGITIIPISRVSLGFAAGGSEFNGETMKQYKLKDKDEEIEYKLPFGGGAGAGMTINPVAFLVVQEDNVKLMPVSHSSCLDRLMDYIPDIMKKITKLDNKKCDKQLPKKDKSKEVKAQEEKVQENMEQKNIEIVESDGEIFGEE